MTCFIQIQGWRISGKGVYMYKGVGVRFADFISFLLLIHDSGFIFYANKTKIPKSCFFNPFI